MKVNDEIKKLDLKTGQAADTFPGGVKFDEKGRRVGAPVCIVQWQDGKPHDGLSDRPRDGDGTLAEVVVALAFLLPA